MILIRMMLRSFIIRAIKKREFTEMLLIKRDGNKAVNLKKDLSRYKKVWDRVLNQITCCINVNGFYFQVFCSFSYKMIPDEF